MESRRSNAFQESGRGSLRGSTTSWGSRHSRSSRPRRPGGTLARIAGFGPRRVAAVRDVLATRLARSRRPAEPSERPSVELLLAIDSEYRRAAATDQLRRIAPKRFNPSGKAWLPVMHVERGGWAFTAMFSNTARAHELGRTADWVVVYYHQPHQPEGQATIVTEWRGPARGQRVVRGRERESAIRDAA
jgi:hypothetical protein